MAAPSNQVTSINLQPYVFVLKEGIEIRDNFLDYSLMLLQMTPPETIPSPPLGHFPPIQQIEVNAVSNVWLPGLIQKV